MSASNTTDIEAIRAAGAESCRSGRRDASVIFGWPMNRSAPLWRPLRVPREPNRTWSGMRLGWGRDDGPFFFSCPGRKPHERCEPGPILLCMGLFSRFCVWAPRCTAHSVSKTRVNALMRCCAASGTRDRYCFALTANRSNSNASCSSARMKVSPPSRARRPKRTAGAR
jgi:hypothetical protein